MSEKQSLPRVMTGVVVSNKMQDAITIKVERRVKHPKYGKFIRKSSKLHARDLGNTCNIGDTVVVKECRPVSKTITWDLVEIKERAA